MQSEIINHHRLDAQGRPSGGQSHGVGFAIAWQDGPLRVEGVEKPRNGAFVEDVIAAAISRIEHYQASPFNCQENAEALMHLKLAARALAMRTIRRQAAGTEGTYQGK